MPRLHAMYVVCGRAVMKPGSGRGAIALLYVPHVSQGEDWELAITTSLP